MAVKLFYNSVQYQLLHFVPRLAQRLISVILLTLTTTFVMMMAIKLRLRDNLAQLRRLPQ